VGFVGLVLAFEAGLTTEYETRTAYVPLAATGAASATVDHLKPGTVYHVRVEAMNGAGAGYGGDVVFTTAPGCSVPHLKGDTLTAAKRALKAHHCALGRVRHKRHRGKRRRHGPHIAHVVSQAPAARTLLPAGTRVGITLA
jgi:hypothetical protein